MPVPFGQLGGKLEKQLRKVAPVKTSLCLTLSNGAADRLEPLLKFKLLVVGAGSVCSGYAGWSKGGCDGWSMGAFSSGSRQDFRPCLIQRKTFFDKRSAAEQMILKICQVPMIWLQFNNR
jgi:hypothetical protein